MRVSAAKAKNLSFATARKVQKIEDRLSFKKEIPSIGQSVKYVYDFDSLGGAKDIGYILSGPSLPLNAVITRAFVVTETALAGATATIDLEMMGANDVLSAEAVASFNAAGNIIGCIQDGTAGNMLLCDDVGQSSDPERKMVMTINTANLTAGKFHVHVEYIVTYK
jgi:hypothetical protein